MNNKKNKKPYFIPEPYGLTFELTEKDTFRKLNENSEVKLK